MKVIEEEWATKEELTKRKASRVHRSEMRRKQSESAVVFLVSERVNPRFREDGFAFDLAWPVNRYSRNYSVVLCGFWRVSFPCTRTKHHRAREGSSENQIWPRQSRLHRYHLEVHIRIQNKEKSASQECLLEFSLHGSVSQTVERAAIFVQSVCDRRLETPLAHAELPANQKIVQIIEIVKSTRG